MAGRQWRSTERVIWLRNELAGGQGWVIEVNLAPTWRSQPGNLAQTPTWPNLAKSNLANLAQSPTWPTWHKAQPGKVQPSYILPFLPPPAKVTLVRPNRPYRPKRPNRPGRVDFLISWPESRPGGIPETSRDPPVGLPSSGVRSGRPFRRNLKFLTFFDF